MDRMKHPPPRLAVIYDGAAGPKVYRIAVNIAANAWNAGSGVRVRRLGELVVPAGSATHPEWVEMLGDAADVPEARPADLEWANVAVIVSGLQCRRPRGAAGPHYRGTVFLDHGARTRIGALVTGPIVAPGPSPNTARCAEKE